MKIAPFSVPYAVKTRPELGVLSKEGPKAENRFTKDCPSSGNLITSVTSQNNQVTFMARTIVHCLQLFDYLILGFCKGFMYCLHMTCLTQNKNNLLCSMFL